MLYLVHVHLAPHPAGARLPLDAAETVADAAPPEARVVHVSAHPSDGPTEAVGIYLRSSAPELAASAARVAWWSALAARPSLGAWRLHSASVALALGSSPP